MNENSNKPQVSGKIVFLAAVFFILAVVTVAFCISQGVFTFKPKEHLMTKGNGLAQIGFESEAPNVTVTPDLSIAKTASPQQTETPEPQEIEIHIVCGAGGEIEPSESFIIKEGESTEFSIKPDKGNIVKELVIDGQNYGRVLKFRIEKISVKHVIEVYFEAKPKPTPSPTPSPSPSLSPSPTGSPTAEPTSPPGEGENPEEDGSVVEDIIKIITNG